MIILITGLPGSGKTAHAVDILAHDAQFADRPKFVMGIPELAIDHSETPPVEQWVEFRQAPEDISLELPYFRFPEGAVVLIDEAQRIYRPRAVGSAVPPHVAAFETHRHTGIDFILITQAPNLIDSNVRRLIGKHIHIRVTHFGRYRYEWSELGDPESSNSRQMAAKSKFKLPSRAFDLYKSSQLHTKIKARIPGYFWLFLVASLLAVALSIYAYQRIISKAPEKTEQLGKAPPGQTPPTKDQAKQALTPEQYLDARKPRIIGMAHTAPVYDEITKPNDAPWIAGCYTIKGNCKCLDQQGTTYRTTPDICKQFISDGIFRDWSPPGQRGTDPPAEARSGGAVPANSNGISRTSYDKTPPPSLPPSTRQGGGFVKVEDPPTFTDTPLIDAPKEEAPVMVRGGRFSPPAPYGQRF